MYHLALHKYGQLFIFRFLEKKVNNLGSSKWGALDIGVKTPISCRVDFQKNLTFSTLPP